MPSRLRSLSGLDAGFLYLEAAGTPMHVGSLMLLEAPRRRGYDFRRALVAHVGERLGRASALRRVLKAAPLGLGHPLWQGLNDTDVDLDWHIQSRRLRAPGTESALLKLVAELHAEMLPRDRPLWQFVVIDGMKSGEVALYTKIHHAVLDGQGGVALAQALLDLTPVPAQVEAKVRAPRVAVGRATVAAAAMSANVRQLTSLLRAMPATLRVAADAARQPKRFFGGLRSSLSFAPRTPFNAQVGPERSYAVASLPLDEVRALASGFGVSSNDVVMALCTATLRAHLKAQDALPEAPLLAAMPVSLRRRGDTEANNQVSMAQCVLPTHLADPVEQLRAIAAATGSIKARVATFRDFIPTDFLGVGAPWWASGLSKLWARTRIAERLPPLANLVVSNVPGPPMALYLAGARLVHSYPVSIVTHGLGLNITVQAYAAHLEIGVIACKTALPNATVLARGYARALRALKARLPQ